MNVSDADWQEHCRYYEAADKLYRAGDLRAALVAFNKALALAKRDLDTLWALGDCWSELGYPRKAERWFRMARTEAAPQDRADLTYNIANALFDQGRFTVALWLYRRVPRSASSFALARKNIRLIRRRNAA